MTQYQFDPSALFDAFHDRPDLDLVREMVGFLYQALIDIEATEVIGAEPHERTITRTTRRNGSRAKTLSTKTGDVDGLPRSGASGRVDSDPARVRGANYCRL